MGISLIAATTLTWYAHDWLATKTPTAVVSTSVPKAQASVANSTPIVASLPPTTPPAQQTATTKAPHRKRNDTSRSSEAGSPQNAQAQSAAPSLPAPTPSRDNCIGKNTFKNVQIHAKYAVDLTTLCNDFEGGTIDGEETGVTVSIPLDEQTGKPIYMGVTPPAAANAAPSQTER